MENLVRILVVDDHPMMREAVRLVCSGSPEIVVVGEAKDGPEAVHLAESLAPDVVLLDLQLPGLAGFAVARKIRRSLPDARILVLSARDDPAALFEAMVIGVHGYLDKTSLDERLCDAIRSVASGETAFTQAQQASGRRQLGDFVLQERAGASVRLTARESQVLRLVAEGRTTRQMAAGMGVSPRTPDSFISSLYRKLGVRSRVQAVRRGRELGLLGPLDGSSADAPGPSREQDRPTPRRIGSS
jgi:DNA-binding NarL/FixJ family response regulator